MICVLAAFVLALPLTASANLHDRMLRRRHAGVAHNPALTRRNTTYSLKDHFVGEDFLQWDFFTGSDPTDGLVSYTDAQTAISEGLATVDDCTNVTTLAVSSTASVAVGGQRPSVRITSPNTYSSGLFIADFAQMPTGCGLWPAYWSVSTTATWPDGGEIDVIEGVNLNTQNQITLHTGGACSMNGSTSTSTANLLGTDCQSSNSDDSGCAYQQTATDSFGSGFNAAGGGVFAHLWESNAITMWFFTRSAIPQDITNGTPDPTSWDTPAAVFPNTDCDISSNFFNHALVIDTTICGDWAGAAYSSSGCPGTCSDIVANSTNFADAQWKINYISVYE